MEGLLPECITNIYGDIVTVPLEGLQVGGPRKVEQRWRQDQKSFEAWRNGCIGYPLIDANMKELSASGFMSNRGWQIVCSFLVRDMGIDWRMGAEWFETCLPDYDPCSNYGNWTYGAGELSWKMILEKIGISASQSKLSSETSTEKK
ncbi:hypothetical protein F3Y22_tig00111402pilonHSYRG01093 [Hibiscus syriacus]|uniref:Cryptochrome/DNA photolyase FAD-binding domain-containing protein n=1 Tax=Hibiscus syriacus TaxID=106335 RepID=A0A6A2YGX0_HIBSY|nr:hypothetical protein F3Y22_tig00111402pilonHSYRG01093 [Hibiscus syriacus]